MYTTEELLGASGMSLANYKAGVRRGTLALSSGTPGIGNKRRHNLDDVLQVALAAYLAQVGVSPSRAAMVWAFLAEANLHQPEAFIFLAPRADDSDLDFRVVLPGGDAGLEHPDAPAVVIAINLRQLRSKTVARLRDQVARRMPATNELEAEA